MRKQIIAIAAAAAVASAAWALPGSSTYPNEKLGSPYGPVPCAGCHKSNPAFENNVFIDVRDHSGASLMTGADTAEIPWKPGETAELHVVVGLKDQDPNGKVAGWFFNLPAGVTLAKGSVNYCYQRINYDVPSQFTSDDKPYRTTDIHHVSFPKYMAPAETELWVGVGAKATGLEAGSPARKETMGLKTIKLKWVHDTMN